MDFHKNKLKKNEMIEAPPCLFQTVLNRKYIRKISIQ